MNTGLLLIGNIVGNIVCICVIYSEETVERSATRLGMKEPLYLTLGLSNQVLNKIYNFLSDF